MRPRKNVRLFADALRITTTSHLGTHLRVPDFIGLQTSQCSEHGQRSPRFAESMGERRKLMNRSVFCSRAPGPLHGGGAPQNGRVCTHVKLGKVRPRITMHLVLVHALQAIRYRLEHSLLAFEGL